MDGKNLGRICIQARVHTGGSLDFCYLAATSLSQALGNQTVGKMA